MKYYFVPKNQNIQKEETGRIFDRMSRRTPVSADLQVKGDFLALLELYNGEYNAEKCSAQLNKVLKGFRLTKSVDADIPEKEFKECVNDLWRKLEVGDLLSYNVKDVLESDQNLRQTSEAYLRQWDALEALYDAGVYGLEQYNEILKPCNKLSNELIKADKDRDYHACSDALHAFDKITEEERKKSEGDQKNDEGKTDEKLDQLMDENNDRERILVEAIRDREKYLYDRLDREIALYKTENLELKLGSLGDFSEETFRKMEKFIETKSGLEKKKAEPEKKDEIEKKAEPEKKDEIEKKAEPEKKDEIEKKAEPERKLETEKQEETAKKDKNENKAETEKKAENNAVAEEKSASESLTDNLGKASDLINRQEANPESNTKENQNAFVKTTDDIQNMLDANHAAYPKNGKLGPEFQKLLPMLNMMYALNRKSLPKDQMQQFAEGLYRLKEQNKKSHGELEKELMDRRKEAIQEAGDIYQRDQKITPELSAANEKVKSINSVLSAICQNPLGLLIMLLIMAANPMMLFGIAALSALNSEPVRRQFQQLPPEEKADFRRREAANVFDVEPRDMPKGLFNEDRPLEQDALKATLNKLSMLAPMLKMTRPQNPEQKEVENTKLRNQIDMLIDPNSELTDAQQKRKEIICNKIKQLSHEEIDEHNWNRCVDNYFLVKNTPVEEAGKLSDEAWADFKNMNELLSETERRIQRSRQNNGENADSSKKNQNVKKEAEEKIEIKQPLKDAEFKNNLKLDKAENVVKRTPSI